MRPNTSSERVDSLERLSNRVYDAIDPQVHGEPRYRRMVRLGVNLLGEELREGNTLESAGELLLAMSVDQLERGGLTVADGAYNDFPAYRDYIHSLPNAPTIRSRELDTIASQYADVKRATLDTSGERETDGRHAIHLMSLAVPYALQYYPELRPGIIAADTLIHDFIEVITQDTPTFGMSHTAYAQKVKDEHGALNKLRHLIGDGSVQLFNAVQNYEEQRRPEDHFIRRFDKEDPFFTHQINRGRQLISFYGIRSAKQFLEKTVPTTERIAQYPGSFPLLHEDRMEFIRRIAEYSDWPE